MLTVFTKLIHYIRPAQSCAGPECLWDVGGCRGVLTVPGDHSANTFSPPLARYVESWAIAGQADRLGQGRGQGTHFHHFLTAGSHLYSASRDGGDGHSVNMWTKEDGNSPRLSGAVSRIPSIQLSSSVSSARMIIISPSSNVSSSSLSASQS